MVVYSSMAEIGNDEGVGGDRRWLEILSVLLILKINQSREEQDHVPSFIHNWSAAVCTANLARQLMHTRLLRRLVPAEVMMAVCKVDVVFVEDGTPLEGSSYNVV